MYTPHQSVHQFSPQRRQVLGTNKRAGQKKAFLGDEEANTVGPQQLFADLKGNSAKKAGTSSTVNKSPSRALAEKNNVSPKRPQDASVPDKAKAAVKAKAPLEASPTKQGRGRSQSPSKASRQASSAVEAPVLTPLCSPQGLEEGTSYLTSATPFPTVPRTPTAQAERDGVSQRQAPFVTPAANIGQAGAMRMRKGELLDAMNRASGQDQIGLDEEAEVTQEQLEEEMYPEIEYMPPSVDVPYDFPPQLDGLPRGKELGLGLSKLSLAGTYRPSSEEKKREILAEVFKFQAGKVDKPELSLKDGEESDEEWPDVQVRLAFKIRPREGAMADGGASVGGRTVHGKPGQVSQRMNLEPSKKTAPGKRTGAADGGGTTFSRKVNSTSAPLKSSTATGKPKALGERKANTNTTMGTAMNPALRDFEDDRMGKIVKAKLQASHDQEPEGFLL